MNRAEENTLWCSLQSWVDVTKNGAREKCSLFLLHITPCGFGLCEASWIHDGWLNTQGTPTYSTILCCPTFPLFLHLLPSPDVTFCLWICDLKMIWWTQLPPFTLTTRTCLPTSCTEHLNYMKYEPSPGLKTTSCSNMPKQNAIVKKINYNLLSNFSSAKQIDTINI